MTSAARPVRAAALFSLFMLGGCAALSHGFLNAAGPVAADQRTIYIIVTCVMFFVGGPVLLLVPIFAWHYRLANSPKALRPKFSFSWILEGFIWIPPSLIVVGLSVLVWHYTRSLDPYRPVAGGPPLRIDTVALDWKWLFVDPARGVAEVNRLVIPVGRPVQLRLTSATVMQSILIPRLAGQIYAMAGMTTHLNFRADRAGTYRGENTQYNGSGFPRQSFTVVALPPAAFADWQRRAAAAAPLDRAGLALLMRKATVATPVTVSHVPAGFLDRVVGATDAGLMHGASR